MRRVLAAFLIGGLPVAATAGTWLDAETALLESGCEAALPVLDAVIADAGQETDHVAAGQQRALCLAASGDPIGARSAMARLLPTVIRTASNRGAELGRHHAVWAKVEIHAGALDVAKQRLEAAMAAMRGAAELDPYDYALLTLHYGVVQHARTDTGGYLRHLEQDVARLERANWVDPSDYALFRDIVADRPVAGDREGLRRWLIERLGEFNPDPVYDALLAMGAQS